MPDLVLNETDKRPLALPLLYDANDPKLSDINITVNNWTGPAITHPDLTRDQILGDALNESQYFIRWIELPQDKFNGSSIGAAILLPQTKNLSLDQSWPHEMILCNFAAGWGTTSLQMDKSDSNADDRVSSKVVKIDTNWDDPGNREPGKGVTDVSSEAGHGDVLTYWDYPRYPQKSISIAQDWAQSLNPVVQSANKTVFHLIMQEQWDLAGSPFAPTVTVKAALTMLIANGLGRVGFNSTFQGNPKSITAPDGSSWIDGNYWLSGKGNVFTVDPEDAKEWVKFHVDSKLQGYAYNTQTVPPRLAIAVMIAYCIIALAHLLYAGITGKFVLISISEALDALALTFHSSTGISSTCWDSISELTVLAVNSAPTEALRNTCAGIRELHIFQLPVRVVAVPDKEGDGSHLELVFANDDTEGDRLKVNRKYGTMTSSLKQS